MSRIEIVICDGCGREVEDGAPFTTIGLPDENYNVSMLDLCGAACVLTALGYRDDEEPSFDEDGNLLTPSGYKEEEEELSKDEEGTLDDLPEGLADEVQYIQDQLPFDEEPEDDAPTPLTMDDRIKNEKMYREQAEQISATMFPVRNKSKGVR